MAATTDHVPPVLVTPELDAGMRLGDRYRLIARLGRGGGGAVWRVFDDKVGEELALKLIDSDTDLERWRREVALARRISHANVCRVYDLGEAGALRWVTMEWIEGESLRALLARGAIADRERLMRQLVDAVAAIHAAGVVHRDLKPENVVVDGAGRAVVVDFGLARRPHTDDPPASGAAPHGSVTDHGTVLGTPRYMAPEQAAGEPADARSDVYALGLVLREIATGSTDDAATAITVPGDARPTAPPPAIAIARPWGPVIERCTAHAPADRLADGVAVRAALIAPRRTRRRALAVAIILAGAGTAVAIVGQRSAAPHGDPPRAIVQRRLTATADTETRPTSIALSRDGATLAYTVGLEIVLREIDSGRATPLAMPTTPGGLALARLVVATGVLGDGRVVAQILDRDHAWGLWAIGPGAPQRLRAHDERMIVAVSPRGDLLAIATPRTGLVAVPLAGGPDRPLIPARPGERLAGLAWSPDGTRVAFVRLAPGGAATVEIAALARPGTSRTIAHERFPDPIDQMTAWPTDGRIVYVANDRGGGAAVMALDVAGGSRPPVAVLRWPGEYVAQLAAGAGRLTVLRGSAERTILIGTVDRRGYLLNLFRGLPEHAPAGPLAGWTADQRLVHAADGDLVVRVPRGPLTVLASGGAIPDAVLGDAVLYHRATAHGVTVGRVALDGRSDQALLALPASAGGPGTLDPPGAAHGSAAPRDPPPVAPLLHVGTDVVRCAGDRAAPCVLQLVDATGARYLRFDPATGALGAELHRVSGPRFVHAMAVSPDGATLALADGSSTVTLVTLADGGIQREPLAPSAQVIAMSWSLRGTSLLLTALDAGDEHVSVIRLSPGGARQLLLHSNHIHYGRVHEIAADNLVAIEARDLALDAWLVEGL